MKTDQEDEFLEKLDEMCDGLQELIDEFEPKQETKELIERAITALQKAQGSL
jgi:hypothetical protein